MTTITKSQDGKFTRWQFSAGGHDFYVIWSPTGYWSVLREEKGSQLKTWGKTFWHAEQMVKHYRTAREQLAQIAAETPVAP